MNNNKRILLRWMLMALVMLGLWTPDTARAQKKRDKSNKPVSTEVDEHRLQADGMLIDAKMWQENGREEDAMGHYRKIINDFPDYAAAYYELGGMMQDRSYLDSALLLTQQAIKLDKGNFWYRLQEAQIYEEQKDYKHLTSCWETIVKQHPDVLEHYYELSNAYLQAGEGEKAIEVLERVEKRYGVSETVSLQQKEIWEAMGRSDMALKEIEQLAKAMPHETKYSAMMAEAYMRKHDYKKAKRYYDQILSNNPNDEYIHFSLASYYLATGDRANSLTHLRKGLQKNVLSCTEKLTVLSSFFKSDELKGERLKEALDFCKLIAEQCEDEVEVAGFYGALLMYDEQYSEAAVQLKKVLAADSSRYETWEMLLICLDATGGEKKELKDYAERAARLFPLHTLPTYLLGTFALMDKDYREAQKLLNRCEMMGFRRGYLEYQTYAMLGDCYYWLGEYSRAWKYFEKALKAKPDDISTLNNYAYFLSEQNEQLDKALQMSAKTIEAEPGNATYLDTYAWILHKLGRDKEALPYMEKAIRLCDEDRETLNEHLRAIKGNSNPQ
ncbi:MAG: tetratricopeptide repeat protein [Bacteroidales bacterium]|nr:tetratricopeptide repeat protein [Bacteroidales bacterium]